MNLIKSLFQKEIDRAHSLVEGSIEKQNNFQKNILEIRSSLVQAVNKYEYDIAKIEKLIKELDKTVDDLQLKIFKLQKDLELLDLKANKLADYKVSGKLRIEVVD